MTVSVSLCFYRQVGFFRCDAEFKNKLNNKLYSGVVVVFNKKYFNIVNYQKKKTTSPPLPAIIINANVKFDS